MHGKETWANLKPINPKQRIKTIKWYSYQWVKINERIGMCHSKKRSIIF